jgi:lipopolysaccharide/colanic/teichoic acid biosynthesis glycosyltransferase
MPPVASPPVEPCPPHGRTASPWSSCNRLVEIAPAPAHPRASAADRRRVPRLRPVVAAPVSLAQQRLAEGLPVVEPAGNRSLGYRAAKRAMDIAGALVLLVVLGPLMLAVFLVLCATTRGKPFFRQRRVGYLGRPFTMVKFRTMRPDAEQMKDTVANEADGPVFKNRRDPRITRLGRILRKTSLDETPQLLHVLSGRMSLVGPRPLILPEVARFEPWQRRRLAVKPGLTCLWQVSGRSEVAFADWMRMDLWYVRRQSLWADCELILRTPWSVLRGRGAY